MFVLYGQVEGRERALLISPDKGFVRSEMGVIEGYGTLRVEEVSDPDALKNAEGDVAYLTANDL
jgi:hypothetical protein